MFSLQKKPPSGGYESKHAAPTTSIGSATTSAPRSVERNGAIPLPSKEKAITIDSSYTTVGNLRQIRDRIARDVPDEWVFELDEKGGRLSARLLIGRAHIRLEVACAQVAPNRFELRVRQTAGLLLPPVLVEQRGNYEGLVQRYDIAFDGYDMDGVHESIGFWAQAAGVYRHLARRQRPAQPLARDASFDEQLGETVGTMRSSLVSVEEKGPAFRTLISDEEPQRGVTHTVRQESGSWVKYSRTDERLGSVSGRYNFVLTTGGQIVIGTIGHYWLSNSGQNVRYAGQVSFNHGAVTTWDNKSGHFVPHPALKSVVGFPVELFKPEHLEVRAKRAADREKKAEAEEKFGAIDRVLAEVRAASKDANARTAVDQAAQRLGISKTKVKDRMLELGMVDNLKKLNWTP